MLYQNDEHIQKNNENMDNKNEKYEKFDKYKKTDNINNSNYTSQQKEQTYKNPTHPSKANDKLLLDLQVYQEPKKPPSNVFGNKNISFPIQPVALSSPFLPPQFQNYLDGITKNSYTPFIYKDYHINLGPNFNPNIAATVFEDALPSPELFTTYKSLEERNNLVSIIRGNFITTEEGEIVNFEGGKQSLTSRVKLLELNPYKIDYFLNNIITNLPDGFQIYKSCYPIKYDASKNSTTCTKGGLNINIRIYKMTVGEVLAGLIKYAPNYKENLNNQIDIPSIPTNQLEMYIYDVWRELWYYTYIRNEINKSMISPNFVQSYCYFLDETSKFTENINCNNSNIKNNNTNKTTPINYNLINSKKPANMSLIILTESPDKNLITWASNIYVQDRNIKTQIYSGNKTDEMWYSIISQMIFVFYVMQTKEFTFTNMNIERNFFIKDINLYGNAKQYWVFRVEGIDYYIPSSGGLLMIDSNYKENKAEIISTKLLKKNSLTANIFVPIYPTNIEIQNQILTNALSCLDMNNFTQYLTIKDGVRPSQNVLDFLSSINNNLNAAISKQNIPKEKKIQSVIDTQLIRYVHNRVGTYIRDIEKDYIRKFDARPFRRGELVIHEQKYDTYLIVLYIKDNGNGEIECISKAKINGKNNTMEILNLKKDLIYHYSEYEPIKQDEKLGEPYLNMDYIIETYNL